MFSRFLNPLWALQEADAEQIEAWCEQVGASKQLVAQLDLLQKAAVRQQNPLRRLVESEQAQLMVWCEESGSESVVQLLGTLLRTCHERQGATLLGRWEAFRDLLNADFVILESISAPRVPNAPSPLRELLGAKYKQVRQWCAALSDEQLRACTQRLAAAGGALWRTGDWDRAVLQFHFEAEPSHEVSARAYASRDAQLLSTPGECIAAALHKLELWPSAGRPSASARFAHWAPSVPADSWQRVEAFYREFCSSQDLALLGW